ncbi:hypothetical protein LLG95_08815 [bacterium]|nr:hypothetical protein [bacterium]
MLSTLAQAADIADRILLARFEQLESSQCPIPAETFEKSLDYLARLTAIRKSLIHLEQDLASPPPNPKPFTGSTFHSDDPDASEHNSDAPDSDLAEPDFGSRLILPAPVRQPSIREIAELPAMPLDRIAYELNRITTELTQNLNVAPSSSSIGSIRSISSMPSISPDPEPTPPPAQSTQSRSILATGSTGSMGSTPPSSFPSPQDSPPGARDSAPPPP